jgi:hypothetical protein
MGAPITGMRSLLKISRGFFIGLPLTALHLQLRKDR